MNPIIKVFHLIWHSLSDGYYDFEGRASRLEYFSFAGFYWSMLLGFITILPLLITDVILQNVLLIAFIGALSIPKFALSFRRLQDSDLSSGWLLLNIIPVIGWFIVLVLKCKASSQGQNRFGMPPLN